MATPTDLIDRYLPVHDLSQVHGIDIRTGPGPVWAAVRGLDLGGSAAVRWLFRLRGLPASALTLRGLQRIGFIPLGEVPERELLLGIVGRFWTPTGHLQHLDREGFLAFDRPGFAKAAWNFRLRPRAQGGVHLSTETRVKALDPASRRRFRRYWLLVGPLSGWVRREALRTVKRLAEADEQE